MSKLSPAWINGMIGVLIFAASLPATRLAVAELPPLFVTGARATLAALLAGPALLAIRPTAIGWGDALQGRIAKAAYLGSHMEYEIAVSGVQEPLFAIVHDVAHPRAIGADVGLGFDLSGLALVPRD